MKDDCFEIIQTKEASLPERTAEQISKLIVEQHLTGEDRLPSEFELAQLLGVGRGTIREGVKLLVARNVLEIRRGKGTYIARNPGEISDPLGFAYCPDQFRLAMDLLEVRSQLEPCVARAAAERASSACGRPAPSWNRTSWRSGTTPKTTCSSMWPSPGVRRIWWCPSSSPSSPTPLRCSSL